MARPSKYSPEFKADAVALWRACGGKRTVRDVAADLNVNTETSRSWIYAAERAAVVAGHSPEPASPEAELARLRAENARLVKAKKEWQLEREILRRAAQYFAKEMKTLRWGFISTHAEVFGVQRLCRALQVSRSGYYRWIAGAGARAARRAAEDALVEEIREIHTDHQGTYGVLRVHAELRGFGHIVNRKRVRRLMRPHDIVGLRFQQFFRSTSVSRPRT